MADTYTIQFRRGMYADFDTSKIRPGEPVAILGNDPSVPSGKALYIAFAANDVRRLCSIEDISEMVNAGQFVGPQGPKGEKGDKGPKGDNMSDEQAQQIEQNKTDAASLKTETSSLKESISTKITKFYASSQGETHLADSDDGNIMDMMLYGKSSQDGTPSPENPVEIKSVVNPTVKVCGKNLVNVPEKLEVIGHKNYTIAVEDKKTYTITLSQTLKAVSPTGTKVAQHWFVFYDSSGKILKQGDFCNMAFSNVGEVLTKTQAFIPPEGAIELVLDISAYFDDNPTLITNYMQVELGSEPTAYEPYHEQTVTLPYTLNAIPVSSDGNVTIDGQQYIADYVDVERGKLVRMVFPVTVLDSGYGPGWSNSHQVLINRYMKNTTNDKIGIILCDKLCPASADDVWNGVADNIVSVHNVESNRLTFRCTAKANDMDSALKFIKSCKIYIALAEPEEIDLTPEEIAAFKALATYYPTTNISVNSEQLDGYTVFNYPISMENGWNYVKQQIGDTRDYIYNMDARTQDTDLQAAEAYVNSEYAVALTELEV